MKKNKIISISLVICFLISLAAFSSCGGKNKGYSKVKSGSGMGNKSHKNRNVWGK